jgi:beta-lactam-binding protein with PASTA domain
VVPNVRGKVLATAKAAIKRAHCSVGKVTKKASRKTKAGRVIGESPRPGTHLRAGARVNLVVSRGRR